jgi:hypothetical protein
VIRPLAQRIGRFHPLPVGKHPRASRQFSGESSLAGDIPPMFPPFLKACKGLRGSSAYSSAPGSWQTPLLDMHLEALDVGDPIAQSIRGRTSMKPLLLDFMKEALGGAAERG